MASAYTCSMGSQTYGFDVAQAGPVAKTMAELYDHPVEKDLDVATGMWTFGSVPLSCLWVEKA